MKNYIKKSYMLKGLALFLASLVLVSCIFTLTCSAGEDFENEYDTEYAYDHDEEHIDVYDDTTISPFGFWFCYILMGFIFPIPFLVLGLVFPRSRAMGYPKYWYLLSLIAGGWILIAIALLVLLILV